MPAKEEASLDCKEDAVPPADGRNQQGQPSIPARWKGAKPTDRLIAGCTLVLAVTAVLQWLTLRETVKLTRNDQRAWVGITSISGPKAIKDGSPFNINAIWGNFGKSPAFKVTCATGLRVQARRDTFEPVYEKDTNALPSSAILWPSLTIGAAPDRPLYFDKQRTDDIRSGQQIIRAYGYAT